VATIAVCGLTLDAGVKLAIEATGTMEAGSVRLDPPEYVVDTMPEFCTVAHWYWAESL